MCAAAMADGGFGARGERRYDTKESMLSQGRRSVAHGDDAGTLGEVGDGPEPTNLTKMAGGPEVEEGIEGGVVARPGPRGSLRR